MKLTLDRIEGDIAVFSDDCGEIREYPASVLPRGASDGDVFEVAEDCGDGSLSFAFDPDATRERAEQISGLFKKLKNKKRGINQ